MGENGEGGSFNEQTRLDFYRMKQQSMEITEERDDEEDDNLSTLKDKYPVKTRLSDEPSLGSQPSFKGL